MNRRKFSYFFVAIFTVASTGLLVTFQNCSNVRLYREDAPAAVMDNRGPFSVKPDKSEKFNKVLFVVDKSGSNFSEGGADPTSPGNDPKNVKRAGSIKAFLDKKRNDPYYKWGYIAFGVNKNKAEAYIGDPALGKFGTPEEMDRALIKQVAENEDGNCTPYLAGLILAKMTIEKDLKENPKEDSVYNVFFLSDGFPNDFSSTDTKCGNATTVKDSPTDPYINGVNEVRSLASGKIFLSTAYYTEPVNDTGRAAGTGLSYMAKAGGGKFVDLVEGNTINFDEIITGEIPVPLKIKRMHVVNLNSGFCDDGSVDTDSDADGLCDKDEVRYNSLFADRLKSLKGQFDPTNRYSFSEDYSDLFYLKYAVLAGGVGLEGCNKKEADLDFDLLNSCEELLMKNAARNGPTQAWTNAMPLDTSDKENSDTDGDGYLDGLEWMTFKDSSTPVSYLSLQIPFGDGQVKGERIIREHRNTLAPLVFGPGQYDGKLVEQGISSKGEKLYFYEQTQLALYPTLELSESRTGKIPGLAHAANENVVLVYYIAVPENDPDGRGILYYSYQKFSSNDASTNLGLNFKSEVFKTYHIPKVK